MEPCRIINKTPRKRTTEAKSYRTFDPTTSSGFISSLTQNFSAVFQVNCWSRNLRGEEEEEEEEEERKRRNSNSNEEEDDHDLMRLQELLANTRAAATAAAASMEGSRTITNSLRSAENLSLPQVQVIVMSANMGCSHCRQRVSKVLSKVNKGLLDYMVDLRKKEVTVRGTVERRKKKQAAHQGSSSDNRSSQNSLGFLMLHCFGSSLD